MTDKHAWFRCSVVGLAALQGVHNIGFPLDDIIDLILKEIDGSKRKKARELAEHTADALAALKHNHEDATVESARLAATKLLRDCGLSDRAFADLALDTDKAATTVLSHARFTADERAEIMPLCRQILTSFYESVLLKPTLLAEILPHIHATTLRRLGDLKTGQKTIVQQLEELRELVGASQVEGIQRENHLTQAALANMFSILKEQNVPPEQLDAKLRQIAERHVELTERLHSLAKSNDEPDIIKRREQAAKALEVGDYDRADQILAEAEAIDRKAIIEQREALDRRQLSVTATICRRGELERIRLNYRKAAAYFAEAASLVSSLDPNLRFICLIEQVSMLRDQGNEFGDNAALIEAISICRQLIEDYSRERVPLDWARIQMSLGIALANLGERESGTERLEKAVEAFNSALLEYRRERAPLQWATTQMNLGLALQHLSERQSGMETLEKAVEAYNNALLEYGRERTPRQWAMTQMNLGNALLTLGRSESGTKTLKKAGDAFDNALLEYRRERIPLQWALTQMNLGNALSSLGERESGTEALEKAIEAYNNALLENRRERAPLQWAMTQMNLGNALSSLGKRERGTETLEKAVEAYNNALLEYGRERTPRQWATTQVNLGQTLASLGERESGTEALEKAVEAYNNALLERTHTRAPLEWASTQMSLGDTLASLGERESGTETLKKAVEAYNNVLLERTRARAPLEWASAQTNLGSVLAMLGRLDRESGTETLEKAAEAFNNALLEATRERDPLQWANIQINLGAAHATLGQHESGTERLEKAVKAFNNALLEATRERVPLQWAAAKMNLGLAFQDIAVRTRNKAVLLQGIDAIRASLQVYEISSDIFMTTNARRALDRAEALLATFGTRIIIQ